MHRHKFLYYIYKCGQQLIFHITDAIRSFLCLSIDHPDLFKNTGTFQGERFIASNLKTPLSGVLFTNT